MTPDKQVLNREVKGVGWSAHWKVPRGLRWLREPEVRKGCKLVAYKAGPVRVSYYFLTNCFVCGGRYMTARIHSEFCSDYCRQVYQRYNHETTDS
jgi:hypothetical protein